DYRKYDGLGHVPLVEADSPLIPELVEWARARLSGEPAAGAGVAASGLLDPGRPRRHWNRRRLADGAAPPRRPPGRVRIARHRPGLQPTIQFFEDRGLGRGWALATIIVLVTTALVAGALIIVPTAIAQADAIAATL